MQPAKFQTGLGSLDQVLNEQTIFLRLIRSPSHELGSVPEVAAREAILSHFDHNSGLPDFGEG